MENKELPINKAYTISEDGKRVLNLFTGKTLKQSIQLINGKPSGYYYVTLCIEPCEWSEKGYNAILPKRIPVHRLVSFTFLPSPPSPQHVWINHKDGNKGNNHYRNLEWTTISENIQHKFNTGLQTMPRGKDHWLYGKKRSKETRAKMGAKKMGTNHPKFKGYYFCEFKRFESANQASKVLGIPAKTIISRCKRENMRLKGWYFLPKE